MVFFDQSKKTSKNIFAFLWLSFFYLLTIMTCLSFSLIQFKRNNKTRKLQPWSFLIKARKQAKIFLLFYDCLSFTYSLLWPVSLFHESSLKGIIKQGSYSHGLFWSKQENKQKYFCFSMIVFLLPTHYYDLSLFFINPV